MARPKDSTSAPGAGGQATEGMKCCASGLHRAFTRGVGGWGPCASTPLSPKSWLEKCWAGLKSCNLPPRFPPAPSSTPSTASLPPSAPPPPPPRPSTHPHQHLPRHSPPSAPPLLTPAQPTSPLPLPPGLLRCLGWEGTAILSRCHPLNVPLGPALDRGAGLTSGSTGRAGSSGSLGAREAHTP